MSVRLACLIVMVLSMLCAGRGLADIADAHPPLDGTTHLEMEGDIALHLVSAADAFLRRQLELSTAQRARHWQRDLSSPAAYRASIEPQRRRLSDMLGLRDGRVACEGLELMSTTAESAIVGRGQGYEVLLVRWPAFGDVYGEGLLLEPTDRAPVANVVALPHCDFTPAQICGLAPGVAPAAQYARRLAEGGCRVVVPALIDRNFKARGITNREWLHRAAYEMGRTLTGYEVNITLALVDWWERTSPAETIGVMGWGDGGLIAWYAAAVDPRIDALCVSGAFGDLQNLWQQPLDRMVFGLLRLCGDAELAAMVAPRPVIIETGTSPQSRRDPRDGEHGAPYQIVRPATGAVREASEQARALVRGLTEDTWLTVVPSPEVGSTAALEHLLGARSPGATLPALRGPPRPTRPVSNATDRQDRMIHRIDRHTQALLRDSHWTRQQRFWDQLDTSSIDAYEKSIARFRRSFRDEVMGSFELQLLPPRPRSRWLAESPKWKRYEVVLDVFDEVFAYGILTVPTDIADGERRPAVVCQHGLEGRPQSVIGERDYQHYRAFATELAERGFVTFAPQNLYIFSHRFRTLQRKANALGKTLFSIITPQHQQIVNWLTSQSFVDPDRVAFYGLSYGGKTAMRVPPLVTDYCLSICSADFNEWVDKNASTHNPRSYVNTGEYEIFEWDLGHTFNYAEMAALIAPRPFMVERGHFDGVADDWTVAWEYARVRHLYAALLKIPDRTEIEWFAGPHAIHGQGTFEFLHRHLNWPQPPSERR